MKYKPVNGRLLVKLHKLPEKTAGGLFLAEQFQDGGPGQVKEGTVVAAADDSYYVKDVGATRVDYEDVPFMENMTVLVWPLEGQQVNLDGDKDLRLFKAEQILAIVSQ